MRRLYESETNLALSRLDGQHAPSPGWLSATILTDPTVREKGSYVRI